MAKTVLILLVLLSFSTTAHSKNLVLFIGDGMGLSIINATRNILLKDKSKLNLDSLPSTALVKTYSLDSVVTDSAASATAIAIGKKTNNRAIGMAPDKKGKKLRNYQTVAEWAKSKGYIVGFVTTTTITHATPAAFYSHTENRGNYDTIADQLIKSKFDLFLGGGQRDFEDSEKLGRFHVVKTKKDLMSTKNLAKPVLGLFSKGHMSYDEERKASEPTLMDMTAFAIDRFKKTGKKFFLIIEGGRIDHALHYNQLKEAMEELVSFDKSIGIALKELSSKKTSILVTADHDTAAVAINGYPDHNTRLMKGKKSSEFIRFASGPQSGYSEKKGNHTAVDVPLYSWGRESDKIRGTYDNTEIYGLLKSRLE